MSPRIRSIIEAVASERGVRPADILGRGMTAKVKAARVEAMRRARALHTRRFDAFTYPALARAFGRDHSTIVQVCRP